MSSITNSILESTSFKKARNRFARRFMQRIWRITHRTALQLSKVSKSRVLVIAPHRDDETFACGGVLLLHRDIGSDIGVVFVTDSAGTEDDLQVRRRLVDVRNAETRLVQERIKFELVADLGVPDGEAVRHEERIAERIQECVNTFQPDIILAPTPVDNHRDHQATAVGVADALRSCHFRGRVWSYEMWSAIWPNIVVDISSVYQEKQELIQLYASQLGSMSYDTGVAGLNRYRGLSVQVEYAESFFVGSAKEYGDCVRELDRL